MGCTGKLTSRLNVDASVLDWHGLVWNLKGKPSAACRPHGIYFCSISWGCSALMEQHPSLDDDVDCIRLILLYGCFVQGLEREFKKLLEIEGKARFLSEHLRLCAGAWKRLTKIADNGSALIDKMIKFVDPASSHRKLVCLPNMTLGEVHFRMYKLAMSFVIRHCQVSLHSALQFYWPQGSWQSACCAAARHWTPIVLDLLYPGVLIRHVCGINLF